MRSLKDTNFVSDWMDVTGEHAVPKIDWIKNKHLDLSYGDHDLQKLDLYLPEGDGPFPLVILVHGGGFAMCDKRDWHLYPGFYALENKFALASVNYRLIPEVHFPTPVDDMIAVIHYLVENAEKYSLNTDNFFLYGTSAGGNLVSMAGLKLAGKENPIAGVAALCPLLDFENQQAFFEIMEGVAPEYAASMRDLMFAYLGNLEDKRTADVKTYITADASPFYIQHGTMDPAVPFEQAVDFYEALGKVRNQEIDVLDVLKSVGHAGGGPEFLEKENIQPILDFFKKLCR